MKKLIAVLTLTLTLSAGCVGPFNAFNSLSSWNTRVTENRWFNELIFVGLWIVPVYEIAALADAVVFNSIEFWGGENLFKQPEPPTPQSELK